MNELTRLINDLTDCCHAQADPELRARAARSTLANYLRQPDWLPEKFQQPDQRAYRPEIIHADDDGTFTLMAMTWLPGQRTPIHDHIAWCVVGMYSGEEQSISYLLHEDERGQYLVPRRHDVWRPGAADVLIPPDEDIHEVICSDAGMAVSIHVYGADIRLTGSSINRRFDHLPVRDGDDVTPRSWREPVEVLVGRSQGVGSIPAR